MVLKPTFAAKAFSHGVFTWGLLEEASQDVSEFPDATWGVHLRL